MLHPKPQMGYSCGFLFAARKYGTDHDTEAHQNRQQGNKQQQLHGLAPDCGCTD